jgi:hypothetical protein
MRGSPSLAVRAAATKTDRYAGHDPKIDAANMMRVR